MQVSIRLLSLPGNELRQFILSTPCPHLPMYPPPLPLRPLMTQRSQAVLMTSWRGGCIRTSPASSSQYGSPETVQVGGGMEEKGGWKDEADG